MKKQLALLTVILLGAITCNSLTYNIKEEISELDKILSLRPDIDKQKRAKIDSLYRLAATSDTPYEAYKDLYNEYRLYNHDTALIYVEQMAKEALPDQLPEVELCRAFVYMCGGLFKEASDILETWEDRYAPVQNRDLMLQFCIDYTRLLWDMKDRVGGEVGEVYNKNGLAMNKRVQTFLSEQDTASFWYAMAVGDLHEGNLSRSIVRCHASLNVSQLSVHNQAITASTLAHLYRLMNDNEAALHYYIQAAICDILSSTYETVALRNVAELLFEEGETDMADRYIHIAMEDAQRYHARHRQVDVAQSLPIIEKKMLHRIRTQQHVAIVLLTIVAVLLLGGIIGIIVLVRQNRALSSASKTIDQMNNSLDEANRLKEQLLGTLLSSRSKYINAVKQYQQDVKQNAVNRKWNSLLTIPKEADARNQRIVLDHQIDTIFLSIYPTFVNDFNNLLSPNERFTLKKDELLNTQLRIFALIRLGIKYNEVIAEILDYSINTVYSYKTRVVAASKMTPDQFYSKLMQIPGTSPK